jgi:REP element-mobilizing transposase RayT
MKGYDYTLSGAYFVTIYVEGGKCLLGDVAADEMRLNAAGEAVLNCWNALQQRFDRAVVDASIVMPNHFHGIIFLSGDDGGEAGTGYSTKRAATRAATRAAPTVGAVGAVVAVGTGDDCGVEVGKKYTGDGAVPSLGTVVGVFKSMTTNEYIRGVRDHGWPAFERRLWQRNYWERIIRNERELEAIQRYIWLNPAIWKKDKLNPGN